MVTLQSHEISVLESVLASFRKFYHFLFFVKLFLIEAIFEAAMTKNVLQEILISSLSR